jgi:hypothetical protein
MILPSLVSTQVNSHIFQTPITGHVLLLNALKLYHLAITAFYSCVTTTKLYAVKTVASHMKNMAKIYRASDSVKCKVPLLPDGASLHRGKGNTKLGNRVANSLHRNAQ